jgi:hypothetical protein
MNNLIYLPFIAFIAAAISYTVAMTSMFKRVRENFGSWHPKLDELIHCPWCFGHYVVFVIFLILPTSYIPWITIAPNSYTVKTLNFFFSSFSVIGMMGVIHYVLLRTYEPVAKAAAARGVAKAMEKLRKEHGSTGVVEKLEKIL